MSKPTELREQTDEQLDLLLQEVQNNLFRLRLQSETERLEAPSEIVKAKREVARITSEGQSSPATKSAGAQK
jgi:large subunit ribosomal protein L29